MLGARRGTGVVFSHWDLASHGREGVSRECPAGSSATWLAARPGGFSTRNDGARGGCLEKTFTKRG